MAQHEHIIIGVDGSAPAANALRWGLAEARMRCADVEVVICWHPPQLAETSGYALGYLTPDEMSADAQRDLADIMTSIECDVHEAATEGRVVAGRLLEGPPGPTLVTEAKGANLLVVGRSGHGGWARLAVGSVSHYVTTHATCPVVVVGSD
jgi:nucleotide-binding universal stress UspA family protein